MYTNETRQPDPDWSRSQAISWCIRLLHNRAMEEYMADRSDENYVRIREALKCAMDELDELSVLREESDCDPPWCDDGRDRCVPCDFEGGPNGGGGGDVES